MELKVDINYSQILKLIKQLPEKEIKKLAEILQSNVNASKAEESLHKIILDAPTWTEADFESYKDVRANLNKSRIT